MTLEINNVVVNLIWLRDNCRCDECYNWKTQQRRNNNIPTNHKIKRYDRDGNNIHIAWNDGHISRYNLDWIVEQLQSNFDLTPILWSADEIQHKLPSIESKNGQLTENDTKTLVTTLLQLGIAFVQNVNPTLESTEKIVNYVGPVMYTIYGGMWELNTELFNTFKDTAYTEEYISCHTDNSYFIESPGVQVFHCTKQAEAGGETFLLDGFKAARLLKERNNKFYECLKSTPIEWQYITDDYHLTHVSKILRTRQLSDELEQVRFNIYDRSPRTPFTKDIDLFYKSMGLFQKLLQDSTLQLKVELQPGTIAFINNWRVLHGRANFHGIRKLHGCYVAMGTLLSKARKLGILK